MKRLVECVPNFSEGRDPAVIDDIVAALRSVSGVLLLDRHMDPDHHRSVITFAAPVEVVGEAAVRAAGRAAERIDLRRHSGGHPRIGATDVLPFVPLPGVTMEECVAIARRTGEEIWRRHQIPVYYYEAAARHPERAALEKIRRGQFEGLREEVLTNPARRPDVGGPALHPTAGATVVGARKFLLAYNIYLDTTDVEAAQRIARKIRTSSGGLPAVKAMGLRAGGRTQVSMNLTDFGTTGLHDVFEAVRREGVPIASSEIVGLIPRKALLGRGGDWGEGATGARREAAAAAWLRLEPFHPGLILENRLTAASAAMASCLGEMVAGLSGAAALLDQFRAAREFFEQAVDRDAAACDAVRRSSRASPEQKEAALQGAATVPLEVYERAATLTALLEQLRDIASPATRSDLDTADALLHAARTGARANVEANLAGLQDEAFRRATQERMGSVAP